MTHWAPKPLRPTLNEGIFQWEEKPVVVKGLSAMQQQRRLDGTPLTTLGPKCAEPPRIPLTLRNEDIVAKGSLAANIKPETDRVLNEDSGSDPEARLEKTRKSVSSYLVAKGVKLPIKF